MQKFKQKFKSLILVLGLLVYLPMVSHAGQMGLIYCVESNGEVQLECAIEEIEHFQLEKSQRLTDSYIANAESGHFDQGLSLNLLQLSSVAFEHPVSAFQETKSVATTLQTHYLNSGFFKEYQTYSPFQKSNSTIVLLN